MLLSIPSLSAGWMADDYWHRFILLDPPTPPWLKEVIPARHKLDLFRFFDGDVEWNRKVIDLGFVPWWTSPEAQGAFFRPLSSLTHWVDHRIWPYASGAMHAHSIFWYGALIVVVAFLYRKVMGLNAAAGLAALLYAIDDAHGVPIAFLANRNALIATFFGSLAILSYIQLIESKRPAWKSLSIAWFTLSLLAGEAGVAALAYIAAHAICLDRRPWPKRIIGIVPYLFVLTLWRAYWNLDGYGVANISVYIDPLHDPIQFLREASHRTPALLLGQWSGLPPDIALLVNELGVLYLRIVAVAFVLLLFACLASLFKKDSTARFWGLGMVLACIPVCATFPSDRLMLFIGIGAFGLMARAISCAVQGLRSNDGRQWLRRSIAGWAALMLVLHGALAFIAFPLRMSAWFSPSALLGRFQIRTQLDDSVEQQTLVVVNTPMALMVGQLPLRNAIDGLPIPRRMRLLSPSAASVALFRSDERTLVVEADPPVLSQPFDRLFRAPKSPLRAGDQFHFADLTATVSRADTLGRAEEIEYQFAVSLDDDSLRWLIWNGSEYEESRPPRIGQRVFIPMKFWGP